MTRAELARELETEGAIAVVRLDAATHLLPLVRALLAGGLRAVELTLTMSG
jgi:2-keto-3-deoxy-6-phosphogluconate aldolase